MLSSVKRKAVSNALELKLRRCKGTALQEFHAALMAKLHGDNFASSSTDYSQGDLKCDGLLHEPFTVFACLRAGQRWRQCDRSLHADCGCKGAE